MIRTKQIFFKEIAGAITGLARIVRYTNLSIPNMIEVDNTKKSSSTKMINMNPLNLRMVLIEEGEFKEGKKDGYCRVLHEDQSCETGFYKANEPWGKFEWHLNVSLAEKQSWKLKPGLYEGYNKCTKEMKLRSFEDRVMAIKPRKENLEDMDDHD